MLFSQFFYFQTLGHNKKPRIRNIILLYYTFSKIIWVEYFFSWSLNIFWTVWHFVFYRQDFRCIQYFWHIVERHDNFMHSSRKLSQLCILYKAGLRVREKIPIWSLYQFSNFLDPDPYSEFGSGSTQLKRGRQKTLLTDKYSPPQFKKFLTSHYFCINNFFWNNFTSFFSKL